MTTHTKEKIYHGISLFCIVLCLWLIGQVAADELVATGAAVHLPPMRSAAGEEGSSQGVGFTLTEEDIEGKLMEYLPDGMTVGQPQITIGADGRVTLSGTVDKPALLECFRTMGIDPPGGSLLTVLAPKQIDLELAVCCTGGAAQDVLHIEPQYMMLAGNRMEGEALPEVLQAELKTMLSGLLTMGERQYTSISFTEGAICLK